MTNRTHAVSRRPLQGITQSATLLLAAALLVSATACGGGDSSTGPGKKNPLGLYALMQVDLKKIPAEIYHGPYFDASIPHFFNQFIVKVTGGELVLQDGDEFHMALDFTISGDGQEVSGTQTADGTYELQGDQIVLDPDDGGDALMATVRNGNVSISLDLLGDGKKINALSFQYRK